MASIAHFQDVLKKQGVQRIQFVGEYLREQDLAEAAVGANYHWRDRLWPPMQMLWAFLVQVLHPGWSCKAAVAEVLAEHAAARMPLNASADPSAYCQARKHVPESMYRRALRTVGQTLQGKLGDAYRWCGRRVWVVDGSSCSMPDTPQLQETFGQPTGPKRGCGFPVAKLVVMFCWATGAVLDVAIGAYRSAELSLWHTLWDQLQVGDVVLGDRFYGAYAELARLKARGCDGVFRLWGARARTIDFRKGKRLGKNDRLFVWSRPKSCPRTLSAKEFAALPATLTVRVLRFHTQVKGFRSRTILVATTLLDPVAYPLEQIAALYGDRWTAELRLRDIKTTLRMDVLRCKSPDMVRKEILMHLLAYDLIRALMWQAAREHGRPLHRLSFAGTMQRFEAMAPFLSLFRGRAHAVTIYRLLLSWIASDVVPDRPHRIEPRAVKRRHNRYDLLTRPRNTMRKTLSR
jgi:hypothetical protein